MTSPRIRTTPRAPRRRPFLRRAACALSSATILAFTLAFAAPALAETPALDARDRSGVAYASETATATSEIWRSLAETYDFDVIFSPKMRDLKVDFNVSDASLGDALDRLALAGSHFWVPLDGQTVLVASDTPQQHYEYQPQAVQTFRLENLRVADAMTALRSIYGLKHVTVDEPRRTLTVRDFAGRVALAKDLIARLDVPEDEVTVELQLVSVPEKLWRTRDAGSLDQLLASRSPLLRTDLGIIGRRSARFDMEEQVSADERLAVGIELEARVHPATREVTLALESRLARAADGGAETESQQTSSSWRIESGHTHWVELPGGLDASGEVLALVMTPTIERVGTSRTNTAQWISAATPMTFSSRSTVGTEAQRAEVKERLRKRLAELPRNPQATDDEPPTVD